MSKSKKLKVYGYENSDGDKGIIIATSLKKAKKVYFKNYPKRKLVEDLTEYYEDGAFLFYAGDVKESTAYCVFPW